MHFHATRLFIENRTMLKLVNGKIPAQFTIDSNQHIQIECRGDAQAIIVRGHQRVDWFFQIGSEQKKISGVKNLSQTAEKFSAGGAVKIADGAAQEKYQEPFAFAASRGHFQQAIQIFAFETNNADAPNVA